MKSNVLNLNQFPGYSSLSSGSNAATADCSDSKCNMHLASDASQHPRCLDDSEPSLTDNTRNISCVIYFGIQELELTFQCSLLVLKGLPQILKPPTRISDPASLPTRPSWTLRSWHFPSRTTVQHIASNMTCKVIVTACRRCLSLRDRERTIHYEPHGGRRMPSAQSSPYSLISWSIYPRDPGYWIDTSRPPP